MQRTRGLSRHWCRVNTVLQHLIHTSKCGEVAAKRVTAGIIIVGDEVLKGQTQDTNSHFICKRLFALGVEVKRISVIGDDLEEIAREVREFSKQFSHVITTGGIGPTHDDKTFEGVAKAFGVPIMTHPELVSVLTGFFGANNLDSAKMKMAQIPSTARLQYGVDIKTGERKTKYPLVSVSNVYIFPGVPSIMEKAFVLLEDLFRDPDVQVHSQELYINQHEASIASDLQRVNNQFGHSVVIGSYPELHNSYYKVKITLESTKQDLLNQARSEIMSCIPAGSVVNYEKDPVSTADQHVYEIVSANVDDAFHSSVRHAVRVVETALMQFKLEEMCLGFNGGKDCTALLHLFHSVVQKKCPNKGRKLWALYIRSRQPFPEVELFVQNACHRYNLELIRYEGHIRENLAALKHNHPEVKAVLMGTRRTDPFSGHLESFSMTDPDWPQLMRVNPILDWSYDTVWRFLRSLSLPYCGLYDHGYTSLDSMDNTHPNPSLQVVDNKGIITYRPAYELREASKERAGRSD